MSAFTEALTAATTDAETLAALARGIDPDGDTPTPEALAAWWHECPDPAKAEAAARLQSLARLCEPDAPRGLVDSLAYSLWTGWDGEAPPALWAAWPMAMRGHEGEPGGKLTPRTVWIRGALPGPLAMSRRWIEADPGNRPAHPLAPVVQAWQGRSKPTGKRHLKAVQERHPPEGSDPIRLTRQPGIVSLATHAPFEAVAVDGEAFATRTIGGAETKVRRWRLEHAQGDFWPGPRTLARNATAGAIFEAVAFLVLSGDERSPLRADLLRLANLAFALTGPTEWTEAEGARYVGGLDTEENRERFHNALWALRGMAVHVPSTQPHGNRWWPMAGADPDPEQNLIAPPRWWVRYMKAIRGTKRGSREREEAIESIGLAAAPVAWRYTGCLFVPASMWGAVERTVSGIEAALLWGSSPRRGKRGDRPDNVTPVRRGGPGPEVFIPWWQVLRLAGENVDARADSKGAANRRYGRRCAYLESAGYFTARNGTAPAGGTVEVVERVRGSRGRKAGLIVRATARFCAAYELNERVNVPVSRLLSAGD